MMRVLVLLAAFVLTGWGQLVDADQRIHSVLLRLEQYLGNHDLTFSAVENGMKVPMNSLIVMPAAIGGEEGQLSIEFNRSDLTRQFIEGFFFGGDPVLRRNHPFAQKQVEPILTDDKFILVIHDGTILHLREDWIVPEGSKTFKGSTVVGIVSEVRGDVLCSLEQEVIRERLREFFVSWQVAFPPGRPGAGEPQRRSDGRIEGTVELLESDRPEYYEPRVVN